MEFRSFHKQDIAEKMLETALILFEMKQDSFSILHLAAAEEVISGLIKMNNKNFINARDKQINTMIELEKIYDVKNAPSQKSISACVNFIRNKTKHHDPSTDSDVITACPELEVDIILHRAIENYLALTNTLTQRMNDYLNSYNLDRF
jgi:hypothetical protein